MAGSGENRLAACLAPILRDLAAAGLPVPVIRDETWHLGPSALTAVVYVPDAEGRGGGSGGGLGGGPGSGLSRGRAVRVPPGLPFADQVALLADQIQEWVSGIRSAAGVEVVWPECPDHQDAHPLRTDVHTGSVSSSGVGVDTATGRAVWRCPRSGRAVCAIGELPSTKPQ